jgi:hypothetical protein
MPFNMICSLITCGLSYVIHVFQLI